MYSNLKYFFNFWLISDNWIDLKFHKILSKYIKNKTLNLKSVIFDATSELRHHNIIMYSMKNGYRFWDLLKITFTIISVFRWWLDGEIHLNVKIVEIGVHN